MFAHHTRLQEKCDMGSAGEVIAAGWDPRECVALIGELTVLRESMLESQGRLVPGYSGVGTDRTHSAANLAHYLAMRRFDVRRLQERLARIGLSSLGRAESHVLANVDKVLGLLHVLAGRPWQPHTADEPAGLGRGQALSEDHAQALFGPAPAERIVRIMVTLPSQAADEDGLVTELVEAGMDIARINCAHDTPERWAAMATRVWRASRRSGRRVRILMDLAGPKLRTGPLAPRAPVVKVRPGRDDFGRVQVPARLGLRPIGSRITVPLADAHVGVRPDWLEELREGDTVDCTDARGAKRHFAVRSAGADGALLESRHTVYVTEGTVLTHKRQPGDADPGDARATVGDVPDRPARLRLHRGDWLRLKRSGQGREARPSRSSTRRGEAKPAEIACTLPQVFEQVRVGERVWFDDGRIGGVIRRASSKGLDIELTDVREGGDDLMADKGINLPDSRLDLPALTDKDIEDLAIVAVHADLVGLSFAQSAADVVSLRQRLQDLGAAHLGVLLKIETRRGFEHLPELLFAAMECNAAGVMIARGDLAVECGYERLAEVQEEILWACEAAHMPVVWATQVLETLARTGRPSRAEITDAAMGVRAECVMLNKGPFVTEAIRTLDDILRRMQAHQAKKRPLMRALKSWRSTAPTAIARSRPALPRVPSD
jgi:pyruvate kinase